MYEKNIGFIGAGNMGGAIIRGYLSSGNKDPDAEIYCCEKNPELVSKLGNDVILAASIKKLAEECKYVILAVKPQNISAVLDELKPFVKPETVLVSICAGISSAYIRSHTVPGAKVIRIMPNTPAKLGFGSAAAAKCEGVTQDEFECIKSLFSSCGHVTEISESCMNEVIALNGSSPAFIFTYAKGFLKYASENGFDENDALSLFGETLVGAGKMLQFSGQSVDEMIKAVSSPGGTTIAGLQVLDGYKIEKAAYEACRACTKRAYELAE